MYSKAERQNTVDLYIKYGKRASAVIREFSLQDGKVYLSPVIDCFDVMVVSWTIGTSPSAELVNTMLDKAIETLGQGERPVIHSDRG